MSENNPTDAELYRRCMVRVKNRIDAMWATIIGKKSVGGRIVTAEFYALQTRKVLEGITLAGICAHREEYRKVKSRLDREWRLSEIVPRLDKINPQWYPTPLENKDGSADPKTGARPLISKKSGFITKPEFIALHGKMGQLLHEDNPIAGLENRDWQTEINQFRERTESIIALLNKHQVFPAPDVMWVVQIHVQPGNKVVVNEFSDIGPAV